MKWLAGAAIVILAVLFVLWKQLGATDAAPQKAASPVVAANEMPGGASVPRPTEKSEAELKAAAAAAALEKQTEAKNAPGEKLDPMSDEFFYKFQELVPKKTTANAAKCYEGVAQRVQRNQKLSFRYNVVIKDGHVSIKDVTIKENTLGNAALETCFTQEVARTTWDDPELPDGTWEDELVLRPERGMKKYMKDNIDYVGDVAPPLDRQP